MIRLELDSARRFRDEYRKEEPVDDLARQMRDDNEADIARLTAELEAATVGDLEISLTGAPVAGHEIQLAYFNRITESVQRAYRAAFRALSQDGRVSRGEAALSIAATSRGSFKVALKTPPDQQLGLLDEPRSDRAMTSVIDVLAAATGDPSGATAQQWASSASDQEVRAMIRVASTAAASQGLTQFRWRHAAGVERTVAVPATAARNLARALAGQIGREILDVEGHLQMGQDEPPRARVVTFDDVYHARITSDELLDQVKALLFDEVKATLLVEMRTSATSGTPSTITELLEIEPAPGRTESESGESSARDSSRA